MQQVREALIAAGARSLASGVEEHLAENTSVSGQFNYTVKEASVGLSKTAHHAPLGDIRHHIEAAGRSREDNRRKIQALK